MNQKAIRGFHLVRFGTAADQKFLLGDFLGTYDQLVINANMVAHMTSALASFLSVRAKKKPYFIDPQTHAFQHDISHLESNSEKKKGEIKRSIKKLIYAYGEPLTSCIEDDHRPILPDDFKNEALIKDFAQRVIDFQMKMLSDQVESSSDAKYYKYLNKKNGISTENIFSPTLLIAPYFYLTANTLDRWLPVNIKSASASKEITRKYNKPLGVQIVISLDVLLDKKLTEKLIDEYSRTNADVFLIWIDSFLEQQASERELDLYVDFLEKLGRYGKVVNLYGGFFSVILGKCKIVKNLIGVTHSLEYGEVRGVIPVGGGIPIAKFYFPVLHTRLKFRDAIRSVRALGGQKSPHDFFEKICNCKVCKEIMKDDPEDNFEEYGKSKLIRVNNKPMEYPLSETKERSVKHYMWCKRKEYKEKLILKDILRELKESGRKLEKVIGLEDVAHSYVWTKVIQKKKKV
ncbi:MAG: hypothetical protein MRK02_00170 [Candidatus Scalindua sp.]|nr:hypothetical protein [Candidatus Scalindua sp.]